MKGATAEFTCASAVLSRVAFSQQLLCTCNLPAFMVYRVLIDCKQESLSTLVLCC